MVVDKTLYNRLEIEPTSDENLIKKAYFKLSRKWHPDKNPDNVTEATKKFQEISEAYEILRDSEKRNQYNQYGMDMINNNGPRMDPNDIFKHFMGGFNPGMGGFRQHFSSSFNFNQRKKEVEQDIVMPLDLSLEDIFQERTRDFKYNRQIFCSDCDGSGSTTKEKITCADCNGTGNMKRVIKRGPMIQQIIQPCSKCNASGKCVDEKNKCTKCNTKGYKIKQESINMTIKKNLFNGKKVLLKDRGHVYKNKTTNLILIVRIKQTSGYNIVNNNNILIEMEIELIESIVGFTKELLYLDGKKYNIKFSSGDSIGDGDIKVIKNMGLYDNSKQQGDIFIKFKVKPIKIEKLNKSDIKQLSKIFKRKVDFIDNNNTVLELTKLDESNINNESPEERAPECHQQ